VLSPVAGTHAEQRPAGIVNAIVIAESLPTGFRVSAVAVEYSGELDLGTSSIPASAFTVMATLEPAANVPAGPRTIVRAYTNDTARRASAARPGRFVILELSTTEANSAASYYRPNSILLNLPGSYSARQVEPIRTRRGTVGPSPTAIEGSSVVRPVVDDFSAHTYTDPNGVSLDYRQFTPAVARGASAARFPLVLALHGLGSSGTDNISQLVGESMAIPFALPERQATSPAFVVAPQRKEIAMGTGWRAPEMQAALANLVKRTIASFPIDPDRVYLVGLSIGSNGGWTLLRGHRGLFAGAILTAGFGVSEPDVLTGLREFPLWVSHAPDDKLVPYDAPGSPLRVMKALDEAGAPVVFAEWAANLPVPDANARASAQLAEASRTRARHMFTTYTAGTNPVFGHGTWIPMFSTPVILDWLFTQVRPSSHPASASHERPRTIVTTDPELDDSNSLVRFLLYANEVTTEGIIYASSQFHWRGDGKGTLFSVPNREYSRGGVNLCPCTSWRWKPGERYIDEAVDIYAKVYGNLKAHDANYPAPEYLKSRIREGNVEFEGDMSKDTPGSNLIKDVLLDDRGGPVYVQAWGGQSTIARALKAIALQFGHSPEWRVIREKVSKKAIIQAFGDQDGTYASYIRPEWPDIEFRQMSTTTWGYGARAVVRPEHASYLSAAWTRENVSSIGPFGAFYRVWRDGRQMVPGDVFDYFGEDATAEELRARGYRVWTPPQEKGAWISEGDSSTFMNLIDNGLRAGENPGYGGWGGRNAPDRDAAGATPRDYATARWFEFAQRDFAARLKWTVTPTFAGANHEPQVSVASGLQVTAAPGATVTLSATASDPDGNALTITWWQYADADTYPGTIAFSAPDLPKTTFQVPHDAANGQTIHALIEVTDNGAPPLTSFQRVIVTVATP
jgi:predicted peptidase